MSVNQCIRLFALIDGEEPLGPVYEGESKITQKVSRLIWDYL